MPIDLRQLEANRLAQRILDGERVLVDTHSGILFSLREQLALLRHHLDRPTSPQGPEDEGDCTVEHLACARRVLMAARDALSRATTGGANRTLVLAAIERLRQQLDSSIGTRTGAARLIVTERQQAAQKLDEEFTL